MAIIPNKIIPPPIPSTAEIDDVINDAGEIAKKTMEVLKGAETLLKHVECVMIELNNNSKKYGSSNTRIEKYLERALDGELLEALAIKLICLKLKEIIRKEPNVVQLQSPITCVGDVHGQFFDL